MLLPPPSLSFYPVQQLISTAFNILRQEHREGEETGGGLVDKQDMEMAALITVATKPTQGQAQLPRGNGWLLPTKGTAIRM